MWRRGGVVCAAAVAAMLVAGPRAARADDTLGEIGQLGDGVTDHLVLKLDVLRFTTPKLPALEMPHVGYDAELKLDLKGQRAHFRLGLGDDAWLGVHVEAHLWSDKKALRTSLVLQLGLAGGSLRFALPDVRLRTQSVQGQSAFVLDVPVFEGHF